MREKKYELIALDMDGTLLDSGQRITPRAKTAVREILARGNQVVLATARCRPQLEEYLECFPQMRYLICENGACVCDLKTGEDLFRRALPQQQVLPVMEAVEKEDVLAAFFIGNRSFMDRRTFLRMEEFGLESYRAVFAKSAVWVEDLFSFYRDRPLEVEKIALFFPSGNLNARDGLHRRAQACARVQERIHSLPVTMAVSASGNMEITGEGVNKGTGLKLLCGHLGLPLSQTAAVGDGENDRELLRLAGLAVAMENASASIRAAAAVTVPDCDHDGAAVAMERYML